MRLNAVQPYVMKNINIWALENFHKINSWINKRRKSLTMVTSREWNLFEKIRNECDYFPCTLNYTLLNHVYKKPINQKTLQNFLRAQEKRIVRDLRFRWQKNFVIEEKKTWTLITFFAGKKKKFQIIDCKRSRNDKSL